MPVVVDRQPTGSAGETPGGDAGAADQWRHGGGQAGPAAGFEAVRAMHAAMSPDTCTCGLQHEPERGQQEARRVCRELYSDHVAPLAWQGDRLAGVAPTASVELGWRRSRSLPRMTCTAAVSSACRWSTWSEARERGLRRSPRRRWRRLGNAAVPRRRLLAKRRIAGGTVEPTFPRPAGDDDYRLGGHLEAVASRESRARWRACARCCSRRRSPWWARVAAAPPWAGPSCKIVTGGFTARSTRKSACPGPEGVPCAASVDDLPGRWTWR